MSSKVLLALFLAVSMGLVTGCGEEPSSAPQPSPPAPRAPSPAPAEPAPVVEESPTEVRETKFVYNPEGRRDPFRSLLEIRTPVARTEPETPLQQYDLTQLRLIGAIVGTDNPRAMVLAPDGKTYIVRVGTKIGKNNGSVVRVEQNRIVVEERFYDFTDEVRTSRQAIEIPKREGV
ncbi:pilus assembly protein PilP [Geoalkalibacter halelectricus]|uniref:Pilus assembly protein PilP n=1 Tax=Geoalkalibacter halelectricus TaxID=2847045 RepID=A0ABY5ZQ80_9BACT|nr:pilus assembly protein PilP [Geoalkalibacter halelectricus]MDO3376766.1 pilus assembly protein PilP [Geoalkalibacter halelectricus]UWZ81283.1 pilus assembly protein PilP [Geoalkalibacter halelectricus]